MAITTEQLVDEQTTYILAANKKGLIDKDPSLYIKPTANEQKINGLYDKTHPTTRKKNFENTSGNSACLTQKPKPKSNQQHMNAGHKQIAATKLPHDIEIIEATTTSTNGNLQKRIVNTSPREPMRILIFSESFYPYTSGISRRFIEVVTRLAVYGFKVHILTGAEVSRGFITPEDHPRS
jgi:hypothetical protein